MDFDKSEQLREDLKNNIDGLKIIKPKSKQNSYNNLVKECEKNINSLINELNTLKNEFKFFKLHTLTTLEQTEVTTKSNRCVSSPFSIYIRQK